MKRAFPSWEARFLFLAGERGNFKAMEITKELEEKVKKAILEASPDGRIPCTVARKIAEQHGVSVRFVGNKINELGVKIYACELGCF